MFSYVTLLTVKLQYCYYNKKKKYEKNTYKIDSNRKYKK